MNNQINLWSNILSILHVVIMVLQSCGARTKYILIRWIKIFFDMRLYKLSFDILVFLNKVKLSLFK